ncbi:tagaturonate reductase [Cohnella thailandensis]|uniref:Tagaturonate reductase n=1 Tax=Cohnella thailandensis TaxID=557557 RepID=A0A841T4M1_9BACL|nr:tagaturonate reductase [Cohnella thailandensis]MBB6637288.1 tagaturonate reductase [Cohnella thailandensis]MBP1976616.1 tagaturonate reductase [Cohnella thailandensis]
MKRLNRDVLNEGEQRKLAETESSPVTVLQIGEGNFLRGFFDWMIQTCREQGLFRGGIAVTQPRPSGKPKIEALAAQDGLYTLVIRGLENGEAVERKELISVFSEAFDPYSDWTKLMELMTSPELRFVVSNTTEAGISYQPTELTGEAIVSFPGKVAYLLYQRFLKFEGAADKGLVFLPCELLDRNGDALRDVVLRYASDWGFPEEFRQWVIRRNRFLNSLVDRIVTGYPGDEQAEAWFSEWGYRDPMLTTAEPYHLWAIEAEPELDEVLPLRRAGLNVHWTTDLKPFSQRKVRILNGAHTWMAPLGLLHGVEHVRELLEHETLGKLVREAVYEDIVPSLPYSRDELQAYADTVFERFGNPYIRHRLADIAMNSLSKFRTRLLPTLASYSEKGEKAPERLALGLAGLLRYYRIRPAGDGSYKGTTLSGASYAVRDDQALLERVAGIWEEARGSAEPLERTVAKLLAQTGIWGADLSEWPGLASAAAGFIAAWDNKEEA